KTVFSVFFAHRLLGVEGPDQIDTDMGPRPEHSPFEDRSERGQSHPIFVDPIRDSLRMRIRQQG
ncbi:MAG: hypothetical protein VX739_16125, partial [Planctomycetota bacterium]|nr:hypothetical protein [Planctomycetota bacterium]